MWEFGMDIFLRVCQQDNVRIIVKLLMLRITGIIKKI